MSQVQCDLTIIKLTNLDLLDIDNLHSGKLFVRYSIHAGGGKRIVIETRELACENDVRWDEASTLQCLQIASDSTKEAMCRCNVVFELRWRRTKGIFGGVAKSRLLGRAEVAWKDDMLGSDQADSSKVRRVDFVTKLGLKSPTLFVRMALTVRELEVRERRRGERDCMCRESCGWINGSEEDVFVASSMINAW